MKAYKFNTKNTDAGEYTKTLKEFLKSKGVLTKFKQLLKDKGYEHKYIEDMGLVEPMHPREMVNTFEWDDTYEGFGFWSKINIEWLEYIGIFKGNYTSQQYGDAMEEYKSFKTALQDLDIVYDVYSSIGEAIDTANEELGCYAKDYITRTLLAGHSYYEVLEIWLGITDVFKQSDKGLRLKSLSDVMMAMERDPKFKAKALCEYVKAHR